MITSLLDTDLYKFTMMQVVLHQFPGAQVEYRFRCRTPGVDLRVIAPALRNAIAELAQLRFKPEELSYLRSLRFIKSDFTDFLALFQLNCNYVEISCTDGFELKITGPWLHTILFEVPLLALINELYFSHTFPELDLSEGRSRLDQKIALVKAHPDSARFRFSEFGSRRRFSQVWQQEVVEQLKDALPTQLTGTSNVELARLCGLTAIGTMAHEYLQAFQALGPRLVDSQRVALEAWAHEYRGDLGIALSDVVGLRAFLNDFDLYFCKLFDGVRHDSGDPHWWGEQMVAHYLHHRIDPASKTFVFSDGLTMSSALALHERFVDRSRPVFGIGTHLSCDLGPAPLNVVIKMTRCNGQPVAKLSDSPGKAMCEDAVYLAYLRQVFTEKAPVVS